MFDHDIFTYSKTCVKRLLKNNIQAERSKKEGKEQESIQSSTTLDPEYQ